MKYTLIIITLFFNNAFAENDWIYGLTNQGWIASSYVNSTNLVIKYPSTGVILGIYFDRFNNDVKSRYYSPKHEEEYSISTNFITKLHDGYIGIEYNFTPVSYTNQLIGFRIDYTQEIIDRSIPEEYYNITNTWYVTLSDTPIEVGEGDVERELLEDEDD